MITVDSLSAINRLPNLKSPGCLIIVALPTAATFAIAFPLAVAVSVSMVAVATAAIITPAATTTTTAVITWGIAATIRSVLTIATATTSAATIASTATASASTTAASLFFTGFVHGQPATLIVLAIKRFYGSQCSTVIFHFNKTETAASAGFTVT